MEYEIKNNTGFVSDNVASISYISSPILLDSDIEIKPFVKWAGGKRQLLPILHAAYPQELGGAITKYAEPFIGGGAVLFDILKTYNLEKIYISDINAELINTYCVIRDNCNNLIYHLADLSDAYSLATEEGKKEFYYKCRSRYNTLKKTGEDTIELAALFIFLNRTCFNGLYRVNRKGEFNVPMGSYKNPTILDEENVRSISKALQKVEIVCADFRQSLDFIDENTFVYIDPPYRPLTASANFTSYSENEFNDEDQKALAKFVRVLDTKGAKILLSNSDPKNTNPDDEFFDELYSGFIIQRISASRMINSNAKARGKIQELLISNY